MMEFSGVRSSWLIMRRNDRRAASASAAARRSSDSGSGADCGDWRGDTLARVRALIREAVPDVVEDWKWRGVPVWSRDGILCTGETYRAWVKLTFARGAALEDPAGLFNASLDGALRRAIDIREGEAIDGPALKALVAAAAALNATEAAARRRKTSRPKATP